MPIADYIDRDRPLHINLNRTLLGCTWNAVIRAWEGRPSMPFRPEGILITGAPPRSLLIECLIGTMLPFGDQPLSIEVLDHIERVESETGKRHPARPTFPTLDPTMNARLRLHDAAGAPLTSETITVTLWGLTPRSL